MSVYRYEAVDVRDPSRPETRRGEISGESASAARAALRAAGLEVLRVDELRTRERRARRAATTKTTAGAVDDPPLVVAGDDTEADADGVTVGSSRNDRAGDGSHDPKGDHDGTFDRWLRGRRVRERADLFDALSTLLSTGVPLLDAVDTLVSSDLSANAPLRKALVAVREDLRSGRPLAVALTRHPSWFERAEIAMVEAAQVGGTLPETLRELAERQARGERLASRLVGALAYPSIVAAVGVLVAVFLATQTLPQLVTVLRSTKLEPPALTLWTIAIGQWLVAWWPLVFLALALVVVGVAFILPRLLARASPEARTRFDLALPLVIRRLALARALRRVAELLRSGLPLVEALRVTAPSCRGLSTGLAMALRRAALRIESGDDVSESLDAPAWFDAELRRLVAVGEAGGGLEPVLLRVAERHERQADRLVDRLSSLLEPAAILVLAALVGTVVMAAVLPLVKLQEVL